MKERILEIMSQEGYKPLDIDSLYNILGLSTPADFTLLAKTLNLLVDENEIIYNSKGEFAPLSFFKMACGIIDVKDAGFAFLDTDFGGIFIPKDKLKGAISYDEVMIKFKLDHKGRLEGEVTRIIKRNTKELVGVVKKERGKNIIKPVDAKLHIRVYVKDEDLKKAKSNDLVRVKITKYYPNNTVDGVILEVYGNKDLPGLDITGLVLSSGVKTTFPKEVEDELYDIKDALDSSAELKNNPSLRDLRNLSIITIDGDDAKDLDDAVYVKKLESGNYLLGVYIASVASYVKDNTFLDLEALERGTSIYLPDRVIPMLPKKLSNGICSLNEGCDRLVMACEMEIDHSGKVLNYEIFEAIINSKHRMTYQNVNKILEEDDETIKKEYEDILEMLYNMENLASILNKMRLKRGAFEFESVEPKLILNEDGKVIDIKLRVQKTAENLIEEFMLVANETVASAMTWLDVPFIYRVHEEPKDEKINRLLLVLNQFGYHIKIKNKKALPKMLQQILLDMNNSERTEEEKTKDAIVSKMMVRSMAKAKYQETNIGHYGLASNCYTHFTSPIRRYPDLMVHRLIKEFMLAKKETSSNTPHVYFANKVNQAALIASSCEKKAEMLERDCVELKKVEYISNHLGEIYYGMISSITQFGMYIMLDNTVEGLVKYNEMKDDYYEVDDILGKVTGERTRKVYKIGDMVKIKVLDANTSKRTVEFKLLGK